MNHKTDKTTLQGAASKPLRTLNRYEMARAELEKQIAEARKQLPYMRHTFAELYPPAKIWHIAMEKAKPKLRGYDVPYIIIDEI